MSDRSKGIVATIDIESRSSSGEATEEEGLVHLRRVHHPRSGAEAKAPQRRLQGRHGHLRRGLHGGVPEDGEEVPLGRGAPSLPPPRRPRGDAEEGQTHARGETEAVATGSTSTARGRDEEGPGGAKVGVGFGEPQPARGTRGLPRSCREGANLVGSLVRDVKGGEDRPRQALRQSRLAIS